MQYINEPNVNKQGHIPTVLVVITRQKLSRLLSAECPLTNTQARAKANIGGIVFWALAPAPTVNCRLQAASQPGQHPQIQTQRFLAPTCFPSLSLRCTGWAARGSRGRGGGLAGSRSFKSKRHRAGMCVHTHTHTHTNPEVLYTHTLTCTLPTLTLYPCFIFSCLSLHS